MSRDTGLEEYYRLDGNDLRVPWREVFHDVGGLIIGLATAATLAIAGTIVLGFMAGRI